MSATNFFFEKGDNPIVKRVPVAATSAVVWTPTTSTRILLTGFSVATNVAGTFKLQFGQGGGVFEGLATGSATVSSPHGFFGPMNTLYDESLYFTSKASATDGYVVNLYGFERP